MISEAGHYTTFIDFARKYGKDINVDQLWEDLLKFEGELIKGTVHQKQYMGKPGLLINELPRNAIEASETGPLRCKNQETRLLSWILAVHPEHNLGECY